MMSLFVGFFKARQLRAAIISWFVVGSHNGVLISDTWENKMYLKASPVSFVVFKFLALKNS
jgi:hypothetical protein